MMRWPDARRRFLASVTVGDGCWLWRGYTNSVGYGQIRVDGARPVAHRFAYEWLVGPVPDGLELDHTCHNIDMDCSGGNDCLHRRCVRPDHLEPVTHLENMRRGRPGAYLAARTHCPQGHPYDEANTYWRLEGGRACRTCRRDSTRKYRQTLRFTAAGRELLGA